MIKHGYSAVTRVPEEEYLRLERAAEYKSEYVEGEIFAMTGASPQHSELAANWIGEFKGKLRGLNCRVFTSDLRVRTGKSSSYVYPDVSIVCGVPQYHGAEMDALSNPTVIVEVLSPSTADYDRGKKFALYREIPSLQDYVLSHSESPWVEHFHREPDSSWIYREYRTLESAVLIPSLNCTVPLADLYAGLVG